MGRPLYEAVPDDVEITKLTVGQRDALSRHRRHENINTMLANENTPVLIGGLALLAITPILFDLIRTALEDAGTIIPDVKWEEIKKGAIVGAGPKILSKESVLFGAGPKILSRWEELFKP